MAGGRYTGDPGRIRPPRVRRRALQALTLPEALDVACCSARLIGDACVLVENHRGLCALGRDEIVVRTGCGPMTIRGRELSLAEVRPDAMLVRGIIDSVGYPEGRHA